MLAHLVKTLCAGAGANYVQSLVPNYSWLARHLNQPQFKHCSTCAKPACMASIHYITPYIVQFRGHGAYKLHSQGCNNIDENHPWPVLSTPVIISQIITHTRSHISARKPILNVG